MSTYNEKAKQSFNTRLRFFKFNCAVNEMVFNKENFLRFKLEEQEAIIAIYTAQYCQWLDNDQLKGIGKTLTVEGAYEAITDISLSKEDESDWFADYMEQFEIRYPYNIFENHSKADTCEYCKMTLDTISKLADNQKIFKKHSTRGYTMEIDRKKPNLEYTTENCVPCCYWCNNAKTDEFDDVEFKPIAQEIRKALESRLDES
ncbi:hypothetical protein [Carboxylicivirga sp. RSCT41]|uniref:hypothetical protein n=1 Tax=Carboxylicivirga agarovorans TaxID=3417570 RepID=UPI003D350CB2